MEFLTEKEELMTNRDRLLQCLSSLLAGAFNRKRGGAPTACYGLSGNYSSWDDAVRASTGYANESILEKTKVALLKVRNGEAVYERDSVLFDEVQYSWPLLAGLLWVAAQSGGMLNVLDFGGSLGSTYFQNAAFLRRLSDVRWNIVEQPGHVKVGRACFEDDRLKFFDSVEDCLAKTQPNVIIISGVLEYVEHPYDVLKQLLGLPSMSVILDRTPFWNGPSDLLCVQKVPPAVYSGSYPSWIFSHEHFLTHVGPEWQVVAEFDTADRLNGPVDFGYKGMILSRTQNRTNQGNW